jgi:SnoaL-like domain
MVHWDGDAGIGGAMVEAFLAGDAEAMIELLSADATFHSPVADYHGRERVGEVLGALVQVLADVRASVRFEGRDTTAAFFNATLDGRRGEGALLVAARPDGSICDLTLMVRPLRSLLAGVERMKVLLAAGERTS